MAVAYGHTHAWASVTPPGSPNTHNFSARDVSVTARKVCTWDTYGPPSQISWNDTWIWSQSATGGNPAPLGGTWVQFGDTYIGSPGGTIFNTESAYTANLTFTISGSLYTRSDAGSLGSMIYYTEDEETEAIRTFYL